MKLYLVQHGEAVPKERDPDRPLSDQGSADVARMSVFLERAGVRPARVIHSGKTRARQTAEILGQVLAPEVALEARTGIDPKDPVDGLAREVADWTVDTLIVGHLPFMGALVARLVGADGEVVGYRPGSVVCLEFGEDRRWRIQSMLRPDLLG